MKKFFMMAVMAVAALTASAQKGDFYITPHMSLGYVHSSDSKGESKELGELDFTHNILGGIGADFEYMLSNSFGLSAGLDYNYIQSMKTTFKNGSSELDVYTSYSFLNIPILAQLHFGEGWAIKAGFQPMFTLAADAHGDGKSGNNVAFQTGSIKDNCESVIFAVPVGLSYTFQDTPITVDLRCNIPVSKVNKNGSDDVKLLGITATVGYRFDL